MALGHRRLSILDLAPTSQQPMVDSELGLTVAFNGCIYNFRELRRELEGRGYRFFSDGDTELITKAYHAWGERYVERFNGMFAFAIVSATGASCARAIVSASSRSTWRSARRDSVSLRPCRRCSQPATLTPQPIHKPDYCMTFHAAVPAPFTILRGIRKLPPATVLTVERDGRRREQVYWDLPGPQRDELEFGEWRDALCDALVTAVERRRTADVPIGVLLSGGLDSSLIVATLAEAGENRIETFSGGFEDIDDLAGNEFRYSVP